MNLKNGSMVGGYPILHAGNISNILGNNGTVNNFITVDQGDDRFVNIFTNFNSSAKNGDIALTGTTSDPKFFMKVGGSWIQLLLKMYGGFNRPGTIITYAGNKAPEGYLECNGGSISRSTYSTLYNEIGTQYGSGNGSSTFNVPNLRGEFLRARDAGRGLDSNRSRGNFQSDDIKSHNHSGNTSTDGRHRHGSPSDRSKTNDDKGTHGHWGIVRDTDRIYTTTEGQHYHSLDIENAGGSETRPRNIALMFCIKI